MFSDFDTRVGVACFILDTQVWFWNEYFYLKLIKINGEQRDTLTIQLKTHNNTIRTIFKQHIEFCSFLVTFLH